MLKMLGFGFGSCFGTLSMFKIGIDPNSRNSLLVVSKNKRDVPNVSSWFGCFFPVLSKYAGSYWFLIDW
jgi:hypothetical protein